jgi:hypothetical protein
MRIQAAPRFKRASTQQDERVAVLALSRVLALDDRFHESCHNVGIPLDFRIPI